MGIITEDLFDLAGVSTTKPVQFVLEVPRPSGAGPTGMVMPRTVTVHPAAGAITTDDLDPGRATVYLDGHHFGIEIPAVGVSARLRDLILDGLATPPSGPSWQSIVAGMLESLNEELAGTYAPAFAGSTSIVTDPITGRVTSVTEDGIVTTFTYNSDGTVATDTRNGITRTYTYDGAGNLTEIEAA
jgi:YD repeat-containing protein